MNAIMGTKAKTFSMSDEEIAMLKLLARQKGLTHSDLLREWIKQEWSEHGEEAVRRFGPLEVDAAKPS